MALGEILEGGKTSKNIGESQGSLCFGYKTEKRREQVKSEPHCVLEVKGDKNDDEVQGLCWELSPRRSGDRMLTLGVFPILSSFPF